MIHYKGMNAAPASQVMNNGLADWYFALCGKRVEQVLGLGVRPDGAETWSSHEPEVTCPKCNAKLSLD